MMIIPQKFFTYIPDGEWNRDFMIKFIDNQSITKIQKENLKYEITSLNRRNRNEEINLREIVLENTGFTITITDKYYYDSVTIIISSDELLEYTGDNYKCELQVPTRDLLDCLFKTGNMSNHVISGRVLITKHQYTGRKTQVGITLNDLNEEIVEAKKTSEALGKNKILWKNWIPGHKYQVSYNKQIIYLGSLPFYYYMYGSPISITCDNWSLSRRSITRREEKIPVYIVGDSYYLDKNDIYTSNLDLIQKLTSKNSSTNINWIFESSKSIKGVDLGEVFPSEGDDLDLIFSMACLEEAKKGGNIANLLRVNKPYIDEEAKNLYLKTLKNTIKNILTTTRSYYNNLVDRSTPSDKIYTEFATNPSYSYMDGIGWISTYIDGSFLGTVPTKDEVIALIDEAKK